MSHWRRFHRSRRLSRVSDCRSISMRAGNVRKPPTVNLAGAGPRHLGKAEKTDRHPLRCQLAGAVRPDSFEIEVWRTHDRRPHLLDAELVHLPERPRMDD